MSEMPPDINTILPYGSSLMPLIYSSFLSDANLTQLLKLRGIYRSSSEKDKYIPIIKNIILSPDEFNSLREQQKTKEDKKKNSGEDISFESDKSLFDLISDARFNVNDLAEAKSGNIKIDGVSSMTVSDNDHVYYEYELIREDISKDWASSKSKHSGRVDIIKKGNTISINSEYTSLETRKINDAIKNRIKENLKNKSKTKKLNISKITFDGFTNTNRILFLFSFLQAIKTSLCKK